VAFDVWVVTHEVVLAVSKCNSPPSLSHQVISPRQPIWGAIHYGPKTSAFSNTGYLE